MQLEFIGAAQTVTGSMHLLRTSAGAVMLDCGLYQGRRHEAYARNRDLEVPLADVKAVVLSHAHIDHSGALPMLFKRGFRGTVYVTPATRSLCTVMLRDAAAIQAADARHLNKQRTRDHGFVSGIPDEEEIVPLYDDEDVVRAIERMIAIPYHTKVSVMPGVFVTFLDAGHVLGSAIVVLDVEDRGKQRRVVFTGDLGRSERPILRDPEVPEDVDVLISESTYGDRLHDGRDKMDDDLARVIERTVKRGGKVIIPSFALERAQEVIYALKALRRAGAIPRVPVYVDSPLTVKITDVFKLHPECYDAEARAMLRGKDSPFDMDDLHYVEDTDASKAITSSDDPAIIIAASGMCEAGRVLHHLKACIEDAKNTILIVGYQAVHTLGRRLVEKRARVRIFGVERERRAEVVVLNGFSAHADQKDLVDFASKCFPDQRGGDGRAPQVVLVHGDLQPQKVLAAKMRSASLPDAAIPAAGDLIEIR
jgi:metallo-beta-lactamase family protein